MNFISLIIMIALISVLVLVHEWGHYMASRMFGVRVAKFGFGMPIGPVLFKTKKGDLEILVHACLLGGYISFPEDEENSENQTLPEDSPERFQNQAKWKQAIIVTAGVFMNAVFAFFLILLAAIIFQKLPTGKTEVSIKSIAKDAYIEKIAPGEIKPGDKILSVNGVEIDSAYKFIFFVQNSKLYDNKVKKETIDKTLEEFLKLNPKIERNKAIPVGTKVFLPSKKAEEMLVVPDLVARGFEKYENKEVELSEDEIKLRNEIYNRQTYVLTRESSALEIATALSDYYKPLNITLDRNGKTIELKDIQSAPNGTLGLELASNEVFRETKTPKQIITQSIDYLYLSTKYMCLGLWQLLTGKIPLSEMHGIIAITKIGSDIIQTQGMLNGLLLTALISMDLAIINLLPIPALDGGHLMFIIIEKIIRRPLNKDTVDKISNFFFALLIILMVLVLFNDIFALITKKF